MLSVIAHSPSPPARRFSAIVLASVAGLLTVAGVTGCQRAPTQQAESGSKPAASTNGQIEILNVSYDVSRELYKQYNPLFSQQYQQQQGQAVKVQQSHGGSSKQALSVANGLQADVVTMNQDSDIDLLAGKGLVDKNWQQAFPNHAVPYTSTMVFLVREHNPKQIHDWQDLAKSGISVVMANPKTSGTARYAFLGAYGAGLHQFNHDESKTQAMVKKLLANVAVYDSGARAATTSFVQRQVGDVLITSENEAHIVQRDFADAKLEVVYPSYSIKINNPVAVVNSVTDKKGTTAAAKAYLTGLWDKPAQQLIAKNFMRPVDADVLKEYQAQFPAIATFEPTEVFGSWQQIMQKFFADGGVFDQLSTAKSS